VDNERVHIEIADNGPGFDAGACEQLFEPYFTTKAGGTGLGLSISYRIVTEHGGDIKAGNNPEGGARLTVSLPVSSPELT
jgi:signal transduction histidine kinase